MRYSLNRTENRGMITSCSCWQQYFGYKPGCHWPSWPPGHTVGHSAEHQPTLLRSLSSDQPSSHYPKPVALPGVVLAKVQDPALGLVELLASAQWSSLSRSLCRDFQTSGRSTLPPNLVSSADLLIVCPWYSYENISLVSCYNIPLLYLFISTIGFIFILDEMVSYHLVILSQKALLSSAYLGEISSLWIFSWQFTVSNTFTSFKNWICTSASAAF